MRQQFIHVQVVSSTGDESAYGYGNWPVPESDKVDALIEQCVNIWRAVRLWSQIVPLAGPGERVVEVSYKLVTPVGEDARRWLERFHKFLPDDPLQIKAYPGQNKILGGLTNGKL